MRRGSVSAASPISSATRNCDSACRTNSSAAPTAGPAWPPRYALPQRPTSLDHGLSYDALGKRQVDVIDIYSTDAKIGKLGLAVLEDDLNYFPRYEAVILYRRDPRWRACRAPGLPCSACKAKSPRAT